MTERDYTFNVMASLMEESRIIHLGDGCSMFDAAQALTRGATFTPCPMCDVFVTLHKLDPNSGKSSVVAAIRGLIVWRDKVQGDDESIARVLSMHNLHPQMFENIMNEMNRQQSDICYCVTELTVEDFAEGTGVATFLLMTARWVLSQAMNTNIDMVMCNIGLTDCLFDSVGLVGDVDPITKKTVWKVKYSDEIFDEIVTELNETAALTEDSEMSYRSKISRVLDTALRHMDKARKMEWAADMIKAFEDAPNGYVDNVFTVWEATYVKLLHILCKCGFKRDPDGDLFIRGDRHSPLRFCYVLNYRNDFGGNETKEIEKQEVPVQEEIVLGSDAFHDTNPDW